MVDKMVELETVKISVGFTHNIGNFENVRTDVELGGTVSPGESVDDAVEEVYNKVEEILVAKAKETYASLTGQPKRDTKINPE